MSRLPSCLHAKHSTGGNLAIELAVSVLHLPAGCKKWGSFGYDRGKGATDWWCLEHRTEPAIADEA